MLCQSQIILLGDCADAKTQVYISIQYCTVCYIHIRLFGHSLHGTAWHGARIHRYPYSLCKTQWTLICSIQCLFPYCFENYLHFQKLIIWQQDFTVSKIKIVLTLLQRKAGTIPGWRVYFTLQKCNRGSYKYTRKRLNQLTFQTLELLAVYPWQHRC